jgi:hypothetical protein
MHSRPANGSSPLPDCRPIFTPPQVGKSRPSSEREHFEGGFPACQPSQTNGFTLRPHKNLALGRNSSTHAQNNLSARVRDPERLETAQSPCCEIVSRRFAGPVTQPLSACSCKSPAAADRLSRLGESCLGSLRDRASKVSGQGNAPSGGRRLGARRGWLTGRVQGA